MESASPAERFVDDEVPHSLRPLFPAALRRAYALVDESIERFNYLGTPGGLYQRGDLLLLAASFEFEQLVESGHLPFDGCWEFFAKPTGKHYVMRTDRAIITTRQIEDPRKKPRRAIFRNNYSEMNASFFDSPEDIQRRREAADKEGARRLLHILHGYHDLSFIHVTYPHPERNRHIYRTPNLMLTPHEVTSDLPPSEGPSESPTPEAVESMERHLRDHDE